MYRKRAFDLVTVSTNAPADAPAVLDFLKNQYASSPNKQFNSADRAALQAAWGAKWNPAAPLTMVIAPGGQVLFQKEGPFDILELRRVVLAAMPDTRGYIGSQGVLDERARGDQNEVTSCHDPSVAGVAPDRRIPLPPLAPGGCRGGRGRSRPTSGPASTPSSIP